MSDHEPIIHLPERTVTIANFWVTQEALDSINVLIHWLDGFEASSNHGRVPGHFELVMHYRSLTDQLRKALRASKCDKCPHIDWCREVVHTGPCPLDQFGTIEKAKQAYSGGLTIERMAINNE
jgi:hypothetical protein